MLCVCGYYQYCSWPVGRLVEGVEGVVGEGWGRCVPLTWLEEVGVGVLLLELVLLEWLWQLLRGC